MWSTEQSVETNASPADAWAAYVDLATWPEWAESLEWAKLDGPLEIGTRGALKPKGFRANKFEVVEVDPGRSFTMRSGPPGGRIMISHEVEPAEGGARITERWMISGPLSPVLARVIGKGVAETLGDDLRRLAEMAEA